jgi:hypothetical protein
MYRPWRLYFRKRTEIATSTAVIATAVARAVVAENLKSAAVFAELADAAALAAPAVAASTPRVPKITEDKQDVSAPNNRFIAMAAINLFAPPR